MDLDRLWTVADKTRNKERLDENDKSFIQDVLPAELATFPHLELPNRVRHPAGFSIAGAPVGTLLKSALLLAGQQVLGRRFDGDEFYERVEKELAFGIMRSHFHNGYPRGTYCCQQCTLAVLPVYEAGAIRYFDCHALNLSVRQIIERGQWRFSVQPNQRMLAWSLGVNNI